MVLLEGFDALDAPALHVDAPDAPVGGVHDDAVVQDGLPGLKGLREVELGDARERRTHGDAAFQRLDARGGFGGGFGRGGGEVLPGRGCEDGARGEQPRGGAELEEISAVDAHGDIPCLGGRLGSEADDGSVKAVKRRKRRALNSREGRGAAQSSPRPLTPSWGCGQASGRAADRGVRGLDVFRGWEECGRLTSASRAPATT